MKFERVKNYEINNSLSVFLFQTIIDDYNRLCSDVFRFFFFLRVTTGYAGYYIKDDMIHSNVDFDQFPVNYVIFDAM